MDEQDVVRGLILAGGEGKRLRPLSYYFQKCMIPIGCTQKPLLEFTIRLMKYHNIKNISILVGYKHEQILNYFNNGDRFGVNLNYEYDDPQLKGTGGALLNVYRSELLASNEVLVVYYGDIISDVNLTDMIKRHRKKRAVATLALSRGYQVRVGVADVNEENVVGWTEKPRLNLYVGTGIIVLNVSALQELELLIKRVTELDIMSHLVPYLIEKGDPVNAYVTDSFWYDVGTTERYEKLDNKIIENRLDYLLKI